MEQKKRDTLLSHPPIEAALAEKAKALAHYEDIIWKVRSGYILILYGAYILVFGKEGLQSITARDGGDQKIKLLVLLLLIIGLSLSVFMIDLGYVRKRLKIAVAIDRMVDLGLDSGLRSLWAVSSDPSHHKS